MLVNRNMEAQQAIGFLTTGVNVKRKTKKTTSAFAEQSKIRVAARSIVFSLTVFSLFILVLEVVLRTANLLGAHLAFAEPCPTIGYRFVPGSKYWVKKENDHPITGRINSYGWRDKEWSVHKSQDTYRIAVLGDSFVEAFQVECDRTFLALTEDKLNEGYARRVELMNFGISGASQDRELLILQNEVEQFSPDAVVLCFLPGNDIRDVSKKTAHKTLGPFYDISENGELVLDASFREMRGYKLRCFASFFRRHSATANLLCERYEAYQQASSAEVASKQMEGFLSLCTNNPDDIYLENYHLNKALIKAVAERCKATKAQFVLVCLNTPAYLPEYEEKYTTLDSTFNANFFEDDLRDYANTLNVEYLGLQRVFRDAYERNQVPLHWGHWNYEGHQVVANALANKLRSVIHSNKDLLYE